MTRLFEELDYRQTPIGALSLRRRRELSLDLDVIEIKLDDDFLMTSLFTASEIALARLALAELPGDELSVAVGGLGLGYTAAAVLDSSSVRSLVVIEFLTPVIEWHETGLLPLGPRLTSDPRCRFLHGDFFALAASSRGLDPAAPDRRFHAVLVDIDHAPDAHLDARSSSFYSSDGLSRLARHLLPDGIFGLWSNAQPDPLFVLRLAEAFGTAWAEPVTFRNPIQNRPFTQTVYLARMESER